jgi:hypothetical protein
MKRLFAVLGLAVFVAASTGAVQADSAKPVTYKNPLAYINYDGNVYLMDVHTRERTAITNDANGSLLWQWRWRDGDNIRTYRNIQWG